jgi:dTDP-4-dehydrorhamnose reductase
MNIAIIGANGFLGKKLSRTLSKKNKVLSYDLINQDETIKINALDLKETHLKLSRFRPDLIINCVAMRSSLECEENPITAMKVNYDSAINILKVSEKLNSKMVFISSSYVFDGIKGDYKENDKTNPLNIYGKTKLLAEKEILKYNKSIILRVDLLYGYNSKEENNGHLSKILKEEEIKISEPKQIRSPLLADDLGDIILKLIDQNQKGIFHIAGEEKIEILEFYQKLEKIIRNKSKIITESKNKRINFPLNSTLNISKIKSLNINISSLKEGINKIKRQLRVN